MGLRLALIDAKNNIPAMAAFSQTTGPQRLGGAPSGPGDIWPGWWGWLGIPGMDGGLKTD